MPWGLALAPMRFSLQPTAGRCNWRGSVLYCCWQPRPAGRLVGGPVDPERGCPGAAALRQSRPAPEYRIWSELAREAATGPGRAWTGVHRAAASRTGRAWPCARNWERPGIAAASALKGIGATAAAVGPLHDHRLRHDLVR